VPVPPEVVTWLQDFSTQHFVPEEKKRQPPKVSCA